MVNFAVSSRMARHEVHTGPRSPGVSHSKGHKNTNIDTHTGILHIY